MTNYRMSITLFLLVGLSLLSVASLAQDDKPDATVEIEEESFLLLIGGTRGEGKLHMKGQTYPFTLKGAGVGGVGLAKMAITGDVYNLKSVDDFPGKYTSPRAGAALGKGRLGSMMQNDAGVELWLRSKTEGVAVQLGFDIFDIKMAQ